MEENAGKRGGQRWATTMHSDIIGTSQITKLKDLRDHQKFGKTSRSGRDLLDRLMDRLLDVL